MTDWKQRARPFVRIGCACLFVFVAFRSFLEMVKAQGGLPRFAAGLFFLGMAFAILKQYRWALYLTSAIVLLCAIVLPVGVLGPFTAGDYILAGKTPPSMMQTLGWLIPIEVLLLAVSHIITPEKS